MCLIKIMPMIKLLHSMVIGRENYESRRNRCQYATAIND